MVTTKQIIDEAYEMGLESFPKYKNAPHLNKEFMKTVPNCSLTDEKGVKLRIKMYKSYIKGWTESHVKSMVI
jgi:hypothetical protein